MLHKAWAPNQKHRGDVAKLLVHRDFRRQGAGSALMLSVEELAKKLGLKMINFDAVAGVASDQLYPHWVIRWLAQFRVMPIPIWATDWTMSYSFKRNFEGHKKLAPLRHCAPAGSSEGIEF